MRITSRRGVRTRSPGGPAPEAPTRNCSQDGKELGYVHLRDHCLDQGR